MPMRQTSNFLHISQPAVQMATNLTHPQPIRKIFVSLDPPGYFQFLRIPRRYAAAVVISSTRLFLELGFPPIPSESSVLSIAVPGESSAIGIKKHLFAANKLRCFKAPAAWEVCRLRLALDPHLPPSIAHLISPSSLLQALRLESPDCSHSFGDHLSVGATHCLIRHRLLAGESTDEVWAYGLPSGVLSRASGSCDRASYLTSGKLRMGMLPGLRSSGTCTRPKTLLDRSVSQMVLGKAPQFRQVVILRQLARLRWTRTLWSFPLLNSSAQDTTRFLANTVIMAARPHAEFPQYLRPPATTKAHGGLGTVRVSLAQLASHKHPRLRSQDRRRRLFRVGANMVLGRMLRWATLHGILRQLDANSNRFQRVGLEGWGEHHLIGSARPFRGRWDYGEGLLAESKLTARVLCAPPVRNGSPSPMPGVEYSLLAAAVTSALESNTERRYPQMILDEVRQIAQHAEENGNPVSLALLKKTGRLEFEVEMSILLTRRLPKHVWGFVTVILIFPIHRTRLTIHKGLINEISGPLEDGVGFEAHGGKAGEFYAVVGVLGEAAGGDKDTAQFLQAVFEDILAAVEEAGKKIADGVYRQRRPRGRVALRYPSVGRKTSRQESTSDSHPLRNRIMTALNTRLARKLTTLVHLPQLEMTPSVWQTLESSAPARDMFKKFGARCIDALASRAISRAMEGNEYQSESNHQVFEPTSLASAERSSQSPCLKVILEAVSSPEVLDALYAATPPASRTAAQLDTSPGDFLKIWVGAFVTHAEHGVRGIRPWWEFILRHLVEAAMRALNPRGHVIPRKRKAETAPGTAKSNKSKTSRVGPVLSVALTDVTNTGAPIDQATAGQTKEPKKPKDTKVTISVSIVPELPTKPLHSPRGHLSKAPNNRWRPSTTSLFSHNGTDNLAQFHEIIQTIHKNCASLGSQWIPYLDDCMEPRLLHKRFESGQSGFLLIGQWTEGIVGALVLVSEKIESARQEGKYSTDKEPMYLSTTWPVVPFTAIEGERSWSFSRPLVPSGNTDGLQLREEGCPNVVQPETVLVSCLAKYGWPTPPYEMRVRSLFKTANMRAVGGPEISIHKSRVLPDTVPAGLLWFRVTIVRASEAENNMYLLQLSCDAATLETKWIGVTFTVLGAYGLLSFPCGVRWDGLYRFAMWWNETKFEMEKRWLTKHARISAF
ncbi:hypothetical protein DFH06DRAFT_1124245 [Mycena polygramma]|nr:hypothetical protein DFH06DRAFT_1124245 [Mycena polygramma]